MVVNILLLFFVLGAAKKKLNPHVSAAIFGAIKGTIYFLVTKSVIVSLIVFVIFYGLIAGLIFFFGKLDKKEEIKDPNSMYSSAPKESFKWEYIPITIFVILIIFGEFIVA
jgi:Ca2+/Na+ antiporter